MSYLRELFKSEKCKADSRKPIRVIETLLVLEPRGIATLRQVGKLQPLEWIM